MESMYMKLISLPMVHTLEDTLAHVHDTTGESRHLSSYTDGVTTPSTFVVVSCSHI